MPQAGFRVFIKRPIVRIVTAHDTRRVTATDPRSARAAILSWALTNSSVFLKTPLLDYLVSRGFVELYTPPRRTPERGPSAGIRDLPAWARR